jgi:hypothetical protein
MLVRQLALFSNNIMDFSALAFKSCHGRLATTNQEQLLQICRLEDTTQANYPRHFAQVPAKPETQEMFVRIIQWQMLINIVATYFEQ